MRGRQNHRDKARSACGISDKSNILLPVDTPAGGELLASFLPDTHVFKAFNTIGAEHMEFPGGELMSGQQLSMLLAGGPEGRNIAEQVRKDTSCCAVRRHYTPM